MPNPRKKIILIVVIILGILAIIGGLCYWLLFGTLEITNLPQNSKLVINGKEYAVSTNFSKRFLIKEYLVQIEADGYIPFSQKIKIKPAQKNILNEPLKKFFVSKPIAQNTTSISTFNDSNKFYYISDGILYKSDKEFNSEALTGKTMSGVTNIFWSPDQKLAITLKEYNAALFDFKQYDILNQTSTPWRDNIKNAVWLNNEKILYYYAPPTGEKSLISTNKAHTELETLLDLRPYIESNSDLILVPGSNLDIFIIGKDVINFNLSTRLATPITNSGNILKGVISPDKKYLALLTQDSLVYYDIQNKKLIETDGKPTLSLAAWINNKTYFISDGRLCVVDPISTKTIVFNSQQIPLLNKTSQITSIDSEILILSDSQLFSIPLE